MVVSQGWSPEGWEAQNFALFFPLPPQFCFFLLSFLGPFVEFWWCLQHRGPEMCTFGLSGCRVKPPARDGVPWTCPLVGCRSSEDRDQGQFSGFVRRHLLVRARGISHVPSRSRAQSRRRQAHAHSEIHS